LGSVNKKVAFTAPIAEESEAGRFWFNVNFFYRIICLYRSLMVIQTAFYGGGNFYVYLILITIELLTAALYLFCNLRLYRKQKKFTLLSINFLPVLILNHY
jgi:hypothetical protein